MKHVHNNNPYLTKPFPQTAFCKQQEMWLYLVKRLTVMSLYQLVRRLLTLMIYSIIICIGTVNAERWDGGDSGRRAQRVKERHTAGKE